MTERLQDSSRIESSLNDIFRMIISFKRRREQCGLFCSHIALWKQRRGKNMKEKRKKFIFLVACQAHALLGTDEPDTEEEREDRN